MKFMAKRRQKRIPGTYDEADLAVQGAAEDYVTLLTGRMAMQERENVARTTLIETMHTHDVQECEVNGYRVSLVASEVVEKVRIKKLEEMED